MRPGAGAAGFVKMLPAIVSLVLALSAAQGPSIPVADTLKASVADGRRVARVKLSSATPSIRLGSAAIARSGADGLHEILRTLPGLAVKDYGGIGGLKTVSVRGFSSAHTAVCVDGFLVSDAQRGGIDLSSYNLGNTKSILVEIGTPDDLFKPAGAFSSAGVISLEGKPAHTGAVPLRASAALTAGSFGTWRPELRVDGRIARGWAASVRAGWLRSDGNYPFPGKVLVDGMPAGDATLRREGSDVSTLNTGLRIDGLTPRGGKVLLAAEWTGGERGLPGPVIFYRQNPTERLWDNDLTVRSSYIGHASSSWRWRTGLSYRRRATRYTNSDAAYPEPVDDRYLQHNADVSATVMKAFPLGAGQIVLSLAQDLVFDALDANVLSGNNPRRISSLSAAHVRYDGRRLRLTAGLSATVVGELAGDAPDKSRLSPSLSASFLLAKNLRLRAFVKDGFRVPTFSDLYYDHFGTIHLVPEKALQTGAGATWQFQAGAAAFSMTMDGYYNRVRDKLVAVPTMFTWHMRNLGRVDMAGADVSAGAVVPVYGKNALRVDASYSFLDARDLSDPSAKNYGHQIQYTPRHSGSLAVSFGGPVYTLGYTLMAIGRRWYQPQNVPEYELPACLDHGVSAGVRFPVGRAAVSLSAQGLNLAGRCYELVRSYPMPGRQFRITIKVTI